MPLLVQELLTLPGHLSSLPALLWGSYYKNTRIQVYLTNQGPSRGKDSAINDSMTYTVIKINNSMIKKKSNQNHHVILRLLHLTPGEKY